MGRKQHGAAAIRAWQFAQADQGQTKSRATTTGGLLGYPRAAAPLTIDMQVAEYERRFDARFAKSIREMLHALTAEHAKRTSTVPKKSFREMHEGLQDKCGIGRDGVIYLLAEGWRAGVRPKTLEEALAFATGFLTRIGSGQTDENERFRWAWNLWDKFLRLFRAHVPCVGPDVPRPDVLLASLDLWQGTDARLPPCHAMRVLCLAERHGLDAEVVTAFAREHGAERLDDIARLMADGLMTSETIWELQTRPDLVRALTHGQLDWLIRAWREGQATDLMAFARDRRRDLRRLRGALFAGPRPSALTSGTTAIALEASFRDTLPVEHTGNVGVHSVLLKGADACGAKPWKVGTYVPSDDQVLGPAFACPPDLAAGLAHRLGIDGAKIDAQAERVCTLFGADAQADRILAALDLLTHWGGMVPAKDCLRLAVAAKEARVQDAFALDVVNRAGPERCAEIASLIEDNLLGLRECQRLLRHPAIIVAERNRLRAFLERYREAQAPADILSFHQHIALPA